MSVVQQKDRFDAQYPFCWLSTKRCTWTRLDKLERILISKAKD